MADGFDPTIGALNTSLNLRMMNHNVINSNIANADTPGFKAQRLDFERTLRDIVANEKVGTEPVQPIIVEDVNGVESLDGNTVDRANEMALLSENQLLFDASAEMLKKKLGLLKYAIAEGGGGGR